MNESAVDIFWNRSFNSAASTSSRAESILLVISSSFELLMLKLELINVLHYLTLFIETFARYFLLHILNA